ADAPRGSPLARSSPGGRDVRRVYGRAVRRLRLRADRGGSGRRPAHLLLSRANWLDDVSVVRRGVSRQCSLPLAAERALGRLRALLGRDWGRLYDPHLDYRLDLGTANLGHLVEL